MRRAAGLLAVVALAAFAFAAPAQAGVSVPVEIMDVGPAVALGPGGGAYPIDVTVKFIPVTYDEPIPTDTFLRMLEGVGKYALANVGADALFKSLDSEEISGGLSLPVVNTKGSVPMRAGFVLIGGVGTRPFLRFDLLGGSETEDTATATALCALRRDRSFALALGPDSAMLTYTLLQ